MFRARLVQTFLSDLLFCYKRMVIGAFTLIQCADIGNSTVLYIQGDIECYTWWQNAVEVYIVLNIVPVLFVLSHTPFCIENKQMSVKMFIVGCLLPVPVMLIYYIQMFVTMRMHRISLRSKSQTLFGSFSLSGQTVVSEQFETRITPNHDWNVKVDEFFQKDEESSEVDSGSYISIGTLGQVYVRTDSDTDIGSEYSTDLIRVKHDESTGSDETMSQRVVNQNNRKTKERKNKSKFNDSREAITYTLLKHYRCLKVFRVRFTWLGIHKLYRMGLVACNIYITDPLRKLCMMSVLLAVIYVANAITKPYKGRNTNIVAIMSCMANITIAFMNIIKVVLGIFGCQINCVSYRNVMLWYLCTVENVLLIYLPAVLVPAALLYVGVQKCRGKSKEE